MAERYKRYAVNVAANTETTIFTAPNDGAGTPGAADSVMVGFFVAATTQNAGTLTVSLTDYDIGTVVKLADTIPLPADTSVDLMPGKMILQHGPRTSDNALTGDILKVTATQAVSVILSMVERV
jgi:hypothetical protein